MVGTRIFLAIVLALALAMACAELPSFEFALPSGSALVIEQTTTTASRNRMNSESVTVVMRVRIIEGGVVGRDTIKSTVQVVRVIVDRKRALFGEKGFWDSASGPLPENWEHQGDAMSFGLSYDMVMSPELEISVANWNAPGEPEAPKEKNFDRGPKTLDQHTVISQFSLVFRMLPNGRHFLGSHWSEKTVIRPQPLYRAENGDVGRGLLQITSLPNRARVATDIDWSLRALKEGMAQLRFTADVIQVYGQPANQFGTLRYDVVNNHPVESTFSTLESHNMSRTETTRTVRYRIE